MDYLLAIAYLVTLSVQTSLGSTPDGNEDILDVQFLEGDIVLTDDQQRMLEASHIDNTNTQATPATEDGLQHAVAVDDKFKWPNGVIPYLLDTNLLDSSVIAIHEAIEEYENKTCVRFREKRTQDIDYVRFHNGYGCSSGIGRRGGQQDISIGRRCGKKGVVIHEIFHALGRWHEQSRHDRNQYIRIHSENIRGGYSRNFGTVSRVFATTNGVPYDYDSVMHYSADAFSRNGDPTITPRNSHVALARLGQREGLSENDIAHVRALYCGGDGQWSGWGVWSSCSRSCNGGERHRMRTCVGDTSCPGMNTDRETCNTDDCPTPPEWSGWSSWSQCTVLCGGGRRVRLRTCINGTSCIGNTHHYEDCNQHNCSKSLSSWSSWSECSQTCKGGVRFRTRICENGAIGDCLKETQQQEECNTHITCEPITEWSECSRRCGNGSQVNMVTMETRACNQQPCHNEICLKGISHLGCYKLSGPLLGFLQYFNESSSGASFGNKTEPIRKCAEHAKLSNLPIFAVSLELCYVGSGDFEGLVGSWVESGVCENGTGSYYGSTLFGDIYRIDNREEFELTATRAENCGVDYCLNQASLDGSCDFIHSGSTKQTYSFSLLVLLLLSLLSLIQIH